MPHLGEQQLCHHIAGRRPDLIVLVHIRNFEDCRVGFVLDDLLMMHFQLAEALGKGHMLVVGNVLVRQHQHFVLNLGGFQRTQGCIIQTCVQVQAGYPCTNASVNRQNVQSHFGAPLFRLLYEFEAHRAAVIIEAAVLNDQDMACSSPWFEWEWILTGGVMVVHQGAQSLRLPSMVEKQFSPRITRLTATELCLCGRWVMPGGR